MSIPELPKTTARSVLPGVSSELGKISPLPVSPDGTGVDYSTFPKLISDGNSAGTPSPLETPTAPGGQLDAVVVPAIFENAATSTPVAVFSGRNPVGPNAPASLTTSDDIRPQPPLNMQIGFESYGAAPQGMEIEEPRSERPLALAQPQETAEQRPTPPAGLLAIETAPAIAVPIAAHSQTALPGGEVQSAATIESAAPVDISSSTLPAAGVPLQNAPTSPEQVPATVAESVPAVTLPVAAAPQTGKPEASAGAVSNGTHPPGIPSSEGEMIVEDTPPPAEPHSAGSIPHGESNPSQAAAPRNQPLQSPTQIPPSQQSETPQPPTEQSPGDAHRAPGDPLADSAVIMAGHAVGDELPRQRAIGEPTAAPPNPPLASGETDVAANRNHDSRDSRRRQPNSSLPRYGTSSLNAPSVVPFQHMVAAGGVSPAVNDVPLQAVAQAEGMVDHSGIAVIDAHLAESVANAAVAPAADVFAQNAPTMNVAAVPAAPAATADAAASTTAAAPLPADSSTELAPRLSEAIQTAHRQGTTLRARLHPAELGTLHIEVSVRDGVLSARLQVENAAAQQLLTDHLAQLHESLHQQGAGVERIEVQLIPPSADPSHAERPEDRGAQPRREGSPGDRQQDQDEHPRDDPEHARDHHSGDLDELDIEI